MKMHTIVMPSEREALFNGSDLGDLKGGAAPFFNTLLTDNGNATKIIMPYIHAMRKPHTKTRADYMGKHGPANPPAMAPAGARCAARQSQRTDNLNAFVRTYRWVQCIYI